MLSISDSWMTTMLRFRQMSRNHLFALCVYSCSLSFPSQGSAADRNGNVIEEFDVAKHGDFLLVPVIVGDREYKFAVDTGSSAVVVDEALNGHLELTGKSARTNGVARELYKFSGHLGGRSNLPIDGEVIGANLSRLREVSGHDIRGIVGMEFLKAHVVHIDFDAGKLLILRKVLESGGRQLRIYFDRWDRPHLDIDFEDGESVDVAIDSGAVNCAICLKSSQMDLLLEQGRIALLERPTSMTTVDGDRNDARVGWVDQLSFGGDQHEQVCISEGPRNLVGLGLLSHYAVTFDFPNGRMYLLKGSRFGERPRLASAGVMFTRSNQETRIGKIREGSPADKAGLRLGDQISQVNGKSPDTFSLFELQCMMTTSGQRVQLEIERSDSRLRTTIEPVTQIPMRPNATQRARSSTRQPAR